MSIKVLKNLRVKINSIMGGFSPTWHLSKEDEYLNAVAIDPEATYGDTTKALGSIIPTSSSKISMGTTGWAENPMWISSAQTSTGIYVYCASGTLYTLSQTLSPVDKETGGIVKVTDSGSGDGMVVYKNYLYLASHTNIARFGPLSTTAPTMVQNYWGDSDTGLSQTKLTLTIYPGVRAVDYPEHVMHAHNDGYVYVADYASGQGMIHSFSVTSAGATTATYADLLLPPGLIPTDIKSYGTDLAILCSPMANFVYGAVPRSGSSALILWDTVSTNFYRSVAMNESIATALVNKNGELYVLCGSIDNHVKLLKYLGGFSFQSLADFNEGTPPPASAADSMGNMIAWGGYGTKPTNFAGVYTYGYRGISGNAVNNIMRISNIIDDSPVITAVKFLLPTSGYPLVGWRADAEYGLDYVGSGIITSRFRTRIFDIGSEFNIKRIRIPLDGYVSADTSITPTVYLDSEFASQVLPAITRDNFPNQERVIDYTNLAIGGMRNFYIDFAWASTAVVGIAPDVTIDLELYD